MIRVLVPNWTRKGRSGNLWRVTGVFGVTPTNSLEDKLVIQNQELGGAYCERSGIWFPHSRLGVDGYGRRVGDRFLTVKPRERR